MPPQRTLEEIRASIDQNHTQLATSVGKLRGEIVEITDWRLQFQRHRKQVLIGAAVAGFVIGGGLAALSGLGRRRKRRRSDASGR